MNVRSVDVIHRGGDVGFHRVLSHGIFVWPIRLQIGLEHHSSWCTCSTPTDNCIESPSKASRLAIISLRGSVGLHGVHLREGILVPLDLTELTH